MKLELNILFKSGRERSIACESLEDAKKMRDVLRSSWRRIVTFQNNTEGYSMTIRRSEIASVQISQNGEGVNNG